jgi:hypothetical protein
MTLYKTKHEGTAILCGSAPCVFEDLQNALALRPGATVLGVNYTPAMFDDIKIEHIWTQHNELALDMRAKMPGVWIHARSNVMGHGVDYHWPSLDWVNGSSGVAGAIWAKLGMGFDEVIMAGIPLSREETRYSEKYPSEYKKKVGFATSAQIEHWLSHLETHQANNLMRGVYSMSGATKDILGYPSA